MGLSERELSIETLTVYAAVTLQADQEQEKTSKTGAMTESPREFDVAMGAARASIGDAVRLISALTSVHLSVCVFAVVIMQRKPRAP